MTNLEFIYKRKSIRKFKDQEVPKEDLIEMLKAATYAPSAKHQQNWHFDVITNKEKIEEISNITIPLPANNITKASTLCFVARDKMLANDQVYNCYNINPMYIRKSQAEEQYEEKQKRLKDGK